MPSEHIIYFQSDDYKLTGTLHLPNMPIPPVVIGCHGLLANRHSMKQISLAKACNAKGMAYLRFDHRGCGDSDGRFSKVTSLSARVKDLYQAVETMQLHSKVGEVIALFGSSFGGTVVLAYAAQHPTATLVTYAAPINSTDINHSNIKDINGSLPCSDLLPDDLEFDIASKLNCVDNILVSHSEGDETVPVVHAHEIFRLSGKNKDLLIFQGGDHRMSDITHQQQFEADFIRWITALI